MTKKTLLNYHIPVNDKNYKELAQIIAPYVRKDKYKIYALYVTIEIDDWKPKFQECNSKGYE